MDDDVVTDPPDGFILLYIVRQGCYILVQGNTVSAMGSFKGLKQGPSACGGSIDACMSPTDHIFEYSLLLSPHSVCQCARWWWTA